MRGPIIARVLGGVAIAAVTAGCSLLPAPAEPPSPLTIDNTTPLDLVAVVNGARFPVPHAAGAQLEAQQLGPRPWTVEVRTAASGRLVAQLAVDAAAGTCQDNADGSGSCIGAADLHDLSCGRIAVYVGVPSLPAPDPNAGQPGDCQP